MTTPPKTDRRIQRTRALLRDALMQLVLDKGYDQITVQDITDQANVARTTFYLHFRDKDELLFETMREMYEEIAGYIIDITAEELFSDDESKCDIDDFVHVAQYADFYRIMLSEKGSPFFLARVRDYLAGVMHEALMKIAPEGQQPRIPYEVMAYMVAGAEIGILRWWLENDMPYEPRRMAFMLQQTMKNGLLWGLGADDVVKS